MTAANDALALIGGLVHALVAVPEIAEGKDLKLLNVEQFRDWRWEQRERNSATVSQRLTINAQQDNAD